MTDADGLTATDPAVMGKFMEPKGECLGRERGGRKLRMKLAPQPCAN